MNKQCVIPNIKFCPPSHQYDYAYFRAHMYMSESIIMPCKCSFNEHVFEITPEQLADAVLRAHNKDDPDSNNGLITKIWGPPSWDNFHATQFGYPIEPTDEEKQDYKMYFTLVGKVLPCCFCKDSYQEFIGPDGDVQLTDAIMESRETLTRWGHALHDRINQKLGVDYGTTYEELCYKYESYRAKCTKTGKGCVMPLDMKSKSYQNSDIKRAPIIDYEWGVKLIPHSRTLGLSNYQTILEKTKDLKRNSKGWMLRDIICTKIIKHMRRNGISSLDSNGLPTMFEMILLAMMCTSLDKEQLTGVMDTVC